MAPKKERSQAVALSGPKTFAAVCMLFLVGFVVSMFLQFPLPPGPVKSDIAGSLPRLLQALTKSREDRQKEDVAHLQNATKQESPQAKSVHVEPKLILWDPTLYWMKIPSGGEKFSRCKVKSCVFITNRRQAQKMRTPDAVIITGDSMPAAPPFQKAPGQVWIYTTHESPVTLREFGQNKWGAPAWRNKIDLTMTYRLDSDFPMPYNIPVKTEQAVYRNYTQILAKKKKLAAQVSSHHCVCQSRRGDYIALMRKHASVDVYGRCGTAACDQTACIKMINETYKFYLSFENSLCSGYVTEKFLSYQSFDVVPVVRGNADYTKFFPKESYVDTRDFKSPRALAEYLNYLDRNDTAYLSYLKAKANYRLTPISEVFERTFCNLCEFLHRPPPLTKPNFDFVQWWSEETSCRKPSDLVDA